MTKGQKRALRLWVNEWRLAGVPLILDKDFSVRVGPGPEKPRGAVLCFPYGKNWYCHPAIELNPTPSLDEVMAKLDDYLRRWDR